MDESELILRAIQGDIQAWETLVQTYQETVFRYGYLILGDPGEAEDIAQETFLRVYRALRSFDTTRPLRPWLLAIAANLARNRQRSAGRHLAALQRWFFRETVAETSIEEKSLQKIEAVSLWDAVRRLSASDQQIIYLRFFLDLSVEETAQAAAVASGTVKSRLHRALERLRDLIARDFPELSGNLSTEETGSQKSRLRG